MADEKNIEREPHPTDPTRDKNGRMLPGKQVIGGGRKPGSKNKRSKAIDEVFAGYNYNSVEKLIWLSKRLETRLAVFDAIQEEKHQGGVKPPTEALREDEQLFFSTNKTLLEYQYPKLRAIEVSASRFSGVQFVINAGDGKAVSGEAWVEESLEENLAIAEARADEAQREEEGADE